jgi:hypothetical protein
MLKWGTILFVLLAGAFIVYSMALGRSLRRASLIGGVNQLRVAEADHAKHGYISNYPTSGYRVWLSTNTVIIGGTQYQCFAEVTGGWGWDGGTLAITTNQTFIWMDARMPPKIVTLGHRPPLFGGPY